MSLRDAIRAKTVGARKQYRSTLVNIDAETVVEVRAPSVARRNEIIKRAKLDTDKDRNYAEMQVIVAILMSYVPDTDELVFEMADKAMLMESESGGYVDKITECAMNYLGLKKDAEEVEKN